MDNNVKRKVDIRNFVQKIGENHFGGINKLLKAKLDFMEEVISLLQLTRITVAESEANPKLAAIYTREAAHIYSTVAAGSPRLCRKLSNILMMAMTRFLSSLLSSARCLS